jgi:hypothetical protein
LTNGTTYFVWIKAKNIVGSSGFSPSASVKLIGNMGAVTVSAGDQWLSLSWAIVALAEQYEVYYSTTTIMPGSPMQIISTTTATISGLNNGTTYYIWVKGKNVDGESNTSMVASGKPLGTPGVPVVIPGYRALSVTWTVIAGADQYDVYYGIDTPTTLATTTTGTTATITGLTNGTTYFVWLRARNANGVSDYGPSANGAPSNVLSPGLYRGGVKIGNQNLDAALSWISANVVNGEDYIIVLGTNESAAPKPLDYSGKAVEITLLGLGSERKITLASNGSMFTINTGVTLTLDENISLVGRSENTVSLVQVNTGSTLIMNDGAKISGNNAGAVNQNGGGVSVSGGIFTMNGGEISGNRTGMFGGGICISGGTFTMNGGIISGNNADLHGGGGGISIRIGATFVTIGASFVMNGGTISENYTANYGGGVSVSGGIFTINGGNIRKNTSQYYGGGICSSGTVIMNGGTISGNTVAIINSSNPITIDHGGGGVYSEGLFTMHGGIISGNTVSGLGSGGGFHVNTNANSTIFRKLPPTEGGQNSGIIYGSEATGVDADGIPLRNSASNNNGYAVYFSSNQKRNTTAGETDQIDTTTGRGLSAYGSPPYGQ